ncbi:MAG: hypothetical protein QW728_07590, partial [Thermoplasmata archaeon]
MARRKEGFGVLDALKIAIILVLIMIALILIWGSVIISQKKSDRRENINIPTSGASNSTGIPKLDSDGDGLPDIDENFIYGTNPYLADTDGDGMNDYWEIKFQMYNETIRMYYPDPLNPTDVYLDPDNDGYDYNHNGIVDYVAKKDWGLTLDDNYAEVPFSYFFNLNSSLREGQMVRIKDVYVINASQYTQGRGPYYSETITFQVALGNDRSKVLTVVCDPYSNRPIELKEYDPVLTNDSQDKDNDGVVDDGKRDASGAVIVDPLGPAEGADFLVIQGIVEKVNNQFQLRIRGHEKFPTIQEYAYAIVRSPKNPDGTYIKEFYMTQGQCHPCFADSDTMEFVSYENLMTLSPNFIREKYHYQMPADKTWIKNKGGLWLCKGDGMYDGWEVFYGAGAFDLTGQWNWTFRIDPTDASDRDIDIDMFKGERYPDGLTNYQEFLPVPGYTFGTDPTKTDSDMDSFSLKKGESGFLNAHDGIERNTTKEVSGMMKYMNPNNADSDDDGMPDGWELFYNLNPLDPADRLADPDNDGLINLREYQRRTHPLDPDTDHDGLPDGWEVQYGWFIGFDAEGRAMYDIDPLNGSDAQGNPDGYDPDNNPYFWDNLTNLQEFIFCTNPHNGDTDGDHLNDSFEIFTVHRIKVDNKWINYTTNATNPDTDHDCFNIKMYDGTINPPKYGDNRDNDTNEFNCTEEFLNLIDDDGDAAILQSNGIDDDGDGMVDDGPDSPWGRPESSDIDPLTGKPYCKNGKDDDGDGVVDDGNPDFWWLLYHPAAVPEGVDEEWLLNDYNEIFVFGTCANSSDTDGDGLSDWYELFISWPMNKNGQIHTDPCSIDTDKDGLTDFEEAAGIALNLPQRLNLLLNNRDDDGDGVVDDGPESPWGKPEENTENGIDDDGDGVVDDTIWMAAGRAENLIRTNPLEPDSDGDGVPDIVECGRDGYNNTTGTDFWPLTKDRIDNLHPMNPDTDGDGIPDGYEYENSDLDGDGLPTWWELYVSVGQLPGNRLHPGYLDSNANNIIDSLEDPDRDNLPNLW